MANPWDGIVSADEIAAYEAAGFGRPQGLGKRPALLIIDVQYRTVGTQRQPFWEAIKEFKTACGEVGWQAVDHIAPLLSLFRELKLPVIYPYVSPKESFDVGRLAEKVPALMKVAANGYQFVPEVAPRDISQQEIEMIWELHGVIFYHRLRQHAYGVKLHTRTDEVIANLLFYLEGAAPRVLASLFPEHRFTPARKALRT